jgi:hypothetical protein
MIFFILKEELERKGGDKTSTRHAAPKQTKERGYLDVPSGAPLSPRGIPRGLSSLGSLPEGKIIRVLLL